MKQLTPRAVPLALVHHANQYLITDQYDNRQGITQIVEGYATALRLHAQHRIPANLHLSGTLIEAIAWHCPWFFDFVGELREQGIVALIGGTYAEHIMPLFDAEFNRRQLDEYLWLCQRHLSCSPSELQICWIPERVWDTAKLAPTLTDATLGNGGYRYVLLDDRLLFPLGDTYQHSVRAAYDAIGPYEDLIDQGVAPYIRLNGERNAAARVHRIATSNGLTVLPIAAHLRYCIPPSSPEHWQHLETIVAAHVTAPHPDTLLVFADDLERTAGVGGWDGSAAQRFEQFLRWLAVRTDVAPVLLPQWLDRHPAHNQRHLDSGTFFEIAQGWQAGENYQGWWRDTAYAPYRHSLVLAQAAIEAAERSGAEDRLIALAWKHLMASTYETAWHDPDEHGVRKPAPWAKALAHHARASLPIVAAARWFAQVQRPPQADLIDVEGDGEHGVVLRNERLFAVLSPLHGGRLIALFVFTDEGGVQIIGNPSDDWNFQQPLHRFMDWPPNHPGALVDAGYEHDRYAVTALHADATGAYVELTNIELDSSIYGTTKTIEIDRTTAQLNIAYQLPDHVTNFCTESCLSPDYYHLLRAGRGAVAPYQNGICRGFRVGDIVVWIALPSDRSVEWTPPRRADAGHGINLGVRARSARFCFVLGGGAVDRRAELDSEPDDRFAVADGMQRALIT